MALWGLINYEIAGNGLLNGMWSNNYMLNGFYCNEIARKTGPNNGKDVVIGDIEGNYIVTWIQEDGSHHNGTLKIFKVVNDNNPYYLEWLNTKGTLIFAGRGILTNDKQLTVIYWDAKDGDTTLNGLGSYH